MNPYWIWYKNNSSCCPILLLRNTISFRGLKIKTRAQFWRRSLSPGAVHADLRLWFVAAFLSQRTMQEHFRLSNNAAKIYRAQKEEAITMKECPQGQFRPTFQVLAESEVFCNHFQPQLSSSDRDTEVQCSVCLDTGSTREQFQYRSRIQRLMQKEEK